MNPHHTGSTPLPEYRALLAVDMKGFSSTPARDHPALTARIPAVLEAAFAASGLASEWERRLFPRHDGDGYAAGFPAMILPFLLNPLLGNLQRALEQEHRDRPIDPGRPVRMRASVDVGPIDDGAPGTEGGGNGTARIALHRLLDDPVLKDLLNRSADSTHLVAVVSGRVMDDAILSRYSGEEPGLYVEYRSVVKTHEGRAHLRVPNATGDLLHHGFLPAPDEPAGASTPSATTRPASTRTTIGRVTHSAVNTGDGDQNIGTLNAGTSPAGSGSGTQRPRKDRRRGR